MRVGVGERRAEELMHHVLLYLQIYVKITTDMRQSGHTNTVPRGKRHTHIIVWQTTFWMLMGKQHACRCRFRNKGLASKMSARNYKYHAGSSSHHARGWSGGILRMFFRVLEQQPPRSQRVRTLISLAAAASYYDVLLLCYVCILFNERANFSSPE